jgi:acetyl-CoA carboxylase biotin carboxyl carrier protein
MAKEVFGYNIDFLKQVKKLLKEANIASLEIEDGENRLIKISKKTHPEYSAAAQTIIPAQPHPHSLQQANAASQALSQAVPVSKESAYSDEAKYHKIKSPVIGTFYESPVPGTPAFVKVGDTVSKDSTVCIVEAMKVMNEIKADVQGKIIEILKANSASVQAQEALFIVEKA